MNELKQQNIYYTYTFLIHIRTKKWEDRGILEDGSIS